MQWLPRRRRKNIPTAAAAVEWAAWVAWAAWTCNSGPRPVRRSPARAGLFFTCRDTLQRDGKTRSVGQMDRPSAKEQSLVRATASDLRRHAPFDRMDNDHLVFLASRLSLAYYPAQSLILDPSHGI